MEDVAGTVAELIRAGKVRYFGLSEAGVDADPACASRFNWSPRAKRDTRCVERNLESEIIPTSAATRNRPGAIQSAERGF